MILTQYRTGRPLVMEWYRWAKATWRGTLVANGGDLFRVRETPEEIDRLANLDDEENEAGEK